MKRKIRILQIAVSVSVMLALLLVGVAAAITIIVDGVKEAAWDGSGGQTPGIQTDINDPAIVDGRDIKEFRWTNDATNMYFLMETYATTIWSGTPVPTLIICLDTDNNTGTGGTYANCNNMSGIDRSIVATRFGADVYDGDPNTGTQIGVGQRNAATVISEIGVSADLLGLVGPACNPNIRMAVYFDGGTTDPDDNTPDSGTIPISCGAPTAITLSNVAAHSAAQNDPAALLLIVAATLVLGLAVVVTVRRRRTHLA